MKAATKTRALLRALLHVFIWLCVFGLWLRFTRDFHPTRKIGVYATAILVSASAAAVYLNALGLRPRFARGRRWAYVLTLCAVVLVLDLAAVLGIGAVYDRLWRPDPLRFGFWFNLLADGLIIGLHVLCATPLWQGAEKS